MNTKYAVLLNSHMYIESFADKRLSCGAYINKSATATYDIPNSQLDAKNFNIPLKTWTEKF